MEPDMWNGARCIRGWKAAARWTSGAQAELKVRNVGQARWSAGREPIPQAHKKGWQPRL